MERLTWRWLWIWVGVLVAGCTHVWSSDGTPVPTREPMLPLLGYTRLPPSLTPSLWPVYAATPLIAAENANIGVSSVARHLVVSGPACYETAVGSLMCLGQVHNPLDKPVEHVTVGVHLLARDGTPLASGEATLARSVLPAGASGPYRVLFDSSPAGYAGAYPFVLTGEIAANYEGRFATLAMQEVSGAFVIDQYQVSLSLANKGKTPVSGITVTMTLLDQYDRVTGFRRVYLDPDRRLAPGDSLALTLKVIPQGPNTVAFDAFAEGYIVPN
ncbi:MAG: hypothetical protein M5U29_09800 [Anaerolineae bacterium]|nr:hypothetical protein [Anaerolineae bacterium]